MLMQCEDLQDNTQECLETEKGEGYGFDFQGVGGCFSGCGRLVGRNVEVLKAWPVGLGRTRARGGCPRVAASGPVDPLREAPFRGPLWLGWRSQGIEQRVADRSRR